jgi:hypothetical protein
VTSTVQAATASVTETVETVKEAVISSVATVQGSVRDTVDSVKDTFDVAQWVQRYPWTVMAGCVAAGYVAGSILKPHRASAPDRSAEPQPYRSQRNGFASDTSQRFAAPPPSKSWWNELVDSFDAETRQLKSLALSTLVGVARDYVTQQVPGPVAPRLAEILDDMTTKLGAKPLPTPVLQAAETSPVTCYSAPG